MSAGANAQQLACAWYETPPGAQSHPHHFHGAIEEAVFVLEGKGALRIGDERIAIAAGDYIALPAGPLHSHSLTNTSDEPLRYLCMSTVSNVDVIGYPDSNKVAFTAGAGASADPNAAPWVARTIRDQPSVDYYDGEDEAR